MAKILFNDFTDFLSALSEAKAEYLLVGGYAVYYHGYQRTTGDLDIWVRNTKENYDKLTKAFAIFGMPMYDMTSENFLNPQKFNVFKFGISPIRIDILTIVTGLEFDEALASSSWVLFDGVMVNMIDLRDLIKAKKAAGRNKDLDDIDNLK